MSGGSWSLKLGSKLDVKSWSGARFPTSKSELFHVPTQVGPEKGHLKHPIRLSSDIATRQDPNPCHGLEPGKSPFFFEHVYPDSTDSEVFILTRPDSEVRECDRGSGLNEGISFYSIRKIFYILLGVSNAVVLYSFFLLFLLPSSIFFRCLTPALLARVPRHAACFFLSLVQASVGVEDGAGRIPGCGHARGGRG